jgi:hypothetical protein
LQGVATVSGKHRLQRMHRKIEEGGAATLYAVWEDGGESGGGILR